MATPTITKRISTSSNPRRFGLLNSRLVPGLSDAGRTVVGAVARLIPGVVEVWGRTLVSISLDPGAEPTSAVPGSVPTEPESSIKSGSVRATESQRFVGLNAITLGAAFHKKMAKT